MKDNAMIRAKINVLSIPALLSLMVTLAVNHANAQYYVAQNPTPAPAQASGQAPAQTSPQTEAEDVQGYSDAAQDDRLISSEEVPAHPRLCAATHFLAPELMGETCCAGCPTWTATADAIILQRSSATGQSLLNDSTSEALYNSSNFDLPFAAGPRLSLTRHNVDGHDIELTYFGINGGNATASFTDSSIPSGLALLQRDIDTLPVSSVSLEEHSSIYSSELNVRTAVADWITLLAGFRWVEFYDIYNAQGVNYITSNSFNQHVGAFNHMYGFQLGADFDIVRRGRETCRTSLTSPFSLVGFIKGGIYYDSADQHSNFDEPDSSTALNAADKRNTSAFLGEVGLQGTYQLTQRITLRGGYQVMWLDGVALAAQQINHTDLASGTASLVTRGTPLYHGATAGLQMVW
jgi:hypothetical protein